MLSLTLGLTPHGRLLAAPADTVSSIDPNVDPAEGIGLLDAFAESSGTGLFHLGASAFGTTLPPAYQWWRGFAARYVTALCLHNPTEDPPRATLVTPPPPDATDLTALANTAPLMRGAEYLSPAVLQLLWAEMGVAVTHRLTASRTDLQSLLKSLNPAWNLVGRVYFNLAENRNDEALPFAFMATYTTHLSANAKVQHSPLGQALREYAGSAAHEKLLALLLPVQRAAECCDWLRPMIEAGEIFHPLRWTPREAARFLSSAENLERSGVIVRMPAKWRANRPPRPKVSATIGGKQPSVLGLEGVLDFSAAMTLDGEPLTDAEIAGLLANTDGLALLRGQWVEVDRDRLSRTMQQFREAEKLARKQGMSFTEAMRFLAGASIAASEDTAITADWSAVTAGPWLAETLARLRNPDATSVDPGSALKGTLRPYQRDGVAWLHLLSSLGLGACLADDMGLGKTIQVLSLLLTQRHNSESAVLPPCLLVAPASLLANWQNEQERFAPSLKTQIVHPSAMTSAEMKQFGPAQAADLDMAITSYGTLLRLPSLSEIPWRMVILDEAQAIKNPQAKQTKAVKALQTKSRVALTGTPVENQLGDLWSIFDFINPGLLGSFKQFSSYAKALAARENDAYGPLRELVRPYILRRMKTDRSIIADLPDKTEVKAWCHLSRRQAALYEQAVRELERALREAEGIQRRGIVLTMLMRLKQICNHPAQWLHDGDWTEAESGKMARLREIAETVAARQEKMLLFTQFKEATAPLSAFLQSIFGRPGLTLHGETAVKSRKDLVRRFQEDETVPFFVLTVKAGGSGLTLTEASHVVHYDRWWNPAVENQATDRAYRIGQKRNVLVHKFVCRGTVEEKIDAMIQSKQGLSDTLLEGGGEINMTELSNDELLRMVRLDLHATAGE